MTTFTWSQVRARRLARHALAEPAPEGAFADVVAAMCGAHAQVLSAAELSVGMRVSGATRTDVRTALWSERSLIKSFGPRGTVHVLATRDLPMWTGALGALPRSHHGHKAGVRLDDAQTDDIVAAVADALADAELTVDELTAEVVARTGAWAGALVMPAFQGMWPRWRMATAVAGARGALCFGPNRGRNVTYTSPRRWLPGFRPLDADTALAELVRRYLYAYGPATSRDFAQWTAMTPAWAADLFADLAARGDTIEPADLDGTPAWIAAGDTEAPTEPPRGVRLLPYFDAYTVGSHPRELVFPGPAGQRCLAGGQGGNFPILLVDGVAAGVWHQRRAGRTLHITVEPLTDLTTAHRRALDEQVARVGEVMEATPKLVIGTVTVGPHA